MKALSKLLVFTGLALAIVEEVSYKPGAGGVLFGTGGFLVPVSSILPAWTIPGTSNLSVRYPTGYPMRLDAWLVVAGLGLAAYGRFVK